MIDVIFTIVTILSSPTLAPDAEALRSTVRNHAGVPVHGGDARPFPLEEAVEHVAHARIAAAIANDAAVRADDLLSVAWHESRYDAAVSTNEGAGDVYADFGAGAYSFSSVRYSCGVMTPISLPRRCLPEELELAYGYYAGMRHLAVWTSRCRTMNPYASSEMVRVCALNGYAGSANDRQVRGYKTWEVFVWRATVIQQARARNSPRS